MSGQGMRRTQRRTLSEMQSRDLLGQFGIRFNRSDAVSAADEAVAAAERIGFPVALKGDHELLAHKSEAGMIRLGLGDSASVREAAEDMLARLPQGGRLSVQEMVCGSRELILGFMRDEVFGPCVSIGVGGILTEALGDVVFRRAPFDRQEALLAIADLKSQELLGAIRGMPAVNRDELAGLMLALAEAGMARTDIAEIDINPLIVAGERAIAVDALVVLEAESRGASDA